MSTSSDYKGEPDLSGLPQPIQPLVLLREFGFDSKSSEHICSWWETRHSHLDLHWLPFYKRRQLLGCSLTSRKIALNSLTSGSPELLLYTSIHEAQHSLDQEDADFPVNYFKTALAKDLPAFLELYLWSERRANDYAVQGLRELGYHSFLDRHESRLRTNETCGEMVYSLVVEDIQTYQAASFTELMLNQIL